MKDIHKGQYATKHAPGTVSDPAISNALKEKASAERFSCAVGLALADDLGVTPSEIGTAADLMEYRIIECQLGLFGYSPDKKIVEPAKSIAGDLQDRIERAVVEGRISCVSCLQIADALAIEETTVAAACEFLGLKIAPCQLGAF
ncbi:MAG: hypothetical protein ACOX8V_05145 [Thermoleophilia bacterium]|jgi:hypothetical protein